LRAALLGLETGPVTDVYPGTWLSLPLPGTADIISLSRTYQEQGQTHAAWDALTPVYARFKEGFNTVDLKAAKALINELSQ
jgi:hypothetical protein